jgi:hypothetical protein
VYTNSESAGAVDKARQEMEINYFSLISITEKSLPVLKRQPEAAIVNVTSIVAFLPVVVIQAIRIVKPLRIPTPCHCVKLWRRIPTSKYLK